MIVCGWVKKIATFWGVTQMNIAGAIQEYLIANKIKQSTISEKCGWSKQKTSVIVRGQQKMTAEEMAAICEALGVPYDYFYRRADNQPGA